MTAPVAAKVTTRISSEIRELLFRVPGYLDLSDERVVAWMDELSKAMPAGKKDAFLTMSSVYQVTGDIKAVGAMLERAFTNGASELDIEAHWIPAYLNLGYPTKAMASCRKAISIAAQNIGLGLPSVATAGAFGFVNELLEQARMANVDLSHVPQINEIRQIAEAAAVSGFEDAEFSSVLDIAGAVLREHRLFWLEEAPRFFVDDDMGSIALRFLLDVTPERAAGLTSELSSEIVSAGLERVPLSVAFVGVAEEVEV